MVLPPVETSPVLLMRFTPNTSEDIIETVMDALEQGGIIIIESEGGEQQQQQQGNNNNNHDKPTRSISSSIFDNDSSSNAFVIGLTTTQKLLEHEAEIIRLVKPCRTTHKHIPTIMDRFTTAARLDFVSDIQQMKKIDETTSTTSNDYEDYDSDGLFTSAERALLVESLINAIPCPTELNEKKCSRHASVSTSVVGEVYQKFRNSTLSSSSTHNKFQKDEFEESTMTLMQVLKQKEYIDVLSPVHIPTIAKRILKDTYSIMNRPPLQAMRDYYGEEVAFYWAWMDFMTKWFAFPGLLGLITFVLRKYRGDTVDTCELTPFVGLFVFCWAVLCTRYWDRREAELAYKWGTYSLSDMPEKRPGFRGKLRRSPITGSMERYYPPSKRRFKCVISGIITLIILAGASVVMVISMNLQGYVSRANKELWGDKDHPLYFPFFAQLAEEGAIFDAKSMWKSFLPVILRAIIVLNINQQYSKIAYFLSDWENWETIQGYQNSVVLKRLLFEAFDAYSILFYLAIYERDALSLRLELVGAFNVDTLRRVFTECVLPWAIRYFTKEKTKDTSGMSKKNDDNSNSQDSGYLCSEADLDEYEPFDDYIEMIIQFGYVTLFASAFPLAAFLAIFANLVEIRTDCWKLTHLFRRRNPVRTNGIGMWKYSLRAIAWLSASSNLFLFAFTSSQLRQWLPDYYHTDERSGQSMPNAS